MFLGEELKSSLSGQVKIIASEESSLAEFSNRPIKPVNISIVGKPQRIDSKFQANLESQVTEEPVSVSSESDITVDQLFVSARETAGKEADQKFQPDQLEAKLNYVEKHGNVVGVVGPAGIGKTTSAKQWALQALQDNLFGKVSFIFYIMVRCLAFTKKMNFLEFLLATILPDWSCDNNVAKEIVSVIQRDPNVLMIFDGIDEADFESESSWVPLPALHSKSSPESYLKHLAGGNLLPRARKIFTSRPSTLYNLHPSHRPKFIVQVLGLTARSQDELGRQICRSGYDQIQSQLKHSASLQALCYIPANFILALSYLADHGGDMQFVTLSRILTFTCCQYSRTEHLKEQDCKFEELAQLAWSGLQNRKLIFQAEDFKNKKLISSTLGAFLNTSITKQANLSHKILSHDKGSYFSHLIWQEYFAAVYLMLIMPLSCFKKFYKQLCQDRWDVVGNFAFGICDLAVFNDLKDIVSGCSLRDLNTKKLLLKDLVVSYMKKQTSDSAIKRTLRWAHEANDAEITSRVSASLTDKIERTFAELLPTDIENLSIVLQASRREKVFIIWNSVLRIKVLADNLSICNFCCCARLTSLTCLGIKSVFLEPLH